MEERVAVTEVSKTYRLDTLTVQALSRVTLSIGAGEFMAIAGPSGSGTTTRLNLLGCLDRPIAGEIAIDGEAISGRSAARRAELRAQKLGFVFQSLNLIPVLTAYEKVEYPLLIGRGGFDRFSMHDPRIMKAADRVVEISDGRLA